MKQYRFTSATLNELRQAVLYYEQRVTAFRLG